MRPAKAKAASLLLLGAALVGACDRSPPAASGPSAAPALKAADPACRLPLHHFTRGSWRELNQAQPVISYAMFKNRLDIDNAGNLLWEDAPITSPMLTQFLAIIKTMTPPPMLLVRSDEGAPCRAVQDALSILVLVGECNSRSCAFETARVSSADTRPHMDD